VVSKLHPFYVIGNGSLSFSDLHHLVRGDEQELGVLVHEFLDQPGAGDAIDFDVFARNPFHRVILLLAHVSII
jgi:hypothetical protein